jgi:hypothetical protein
MEALPTRLFVCVSLVAALAGCSPESESPRLRSTEPDEPTWRGLQAYAYTSPVPPLDATTLDGTYTRVLTVAQAGGAPIACRRCAPFRLDPGITWLAFDRGRYFLVFQPAGTGDVCPGCKPPGSFRATGHFVIEDDRLELFNDPNCQESRGAYRWNIEGETLRFEIVSDDCFGGIRGRFLAERPWHAAEVP